MKISFFLYIAGLWLSLLLTGSCRVQQRVREQRQYSLRQEYLHSDSLHNSIQRLYFSDDSNATEILLLPVDSFHYSTAEGYTGKARAIHIRQKQQRRQLRRDSINRHRFANTAGTGSIRQQEYYRQLQQVPSFSLVWTLLPWALLLITLFILYRFVRFKRPYG